MRQTRSPPNGGIHFNHGHILRAELSHRQALEPSAIGQPVMDKVHRITESGLAGQRQRDTRDGHGLLSRLAAQREPFFPIGPFDLLVIHPPTFPSQSHVDPRATIASLGLGDLSPPCPERLVV